MHGPVLTALPPTLHISYHIYVRQTFCTCAFLVMNEVFTLESCASRLTVGWEWDKTLTVILSTDSQSNGDVRLANMTEAKSGRLEIFLSRQWGTVCSDGFTKGAALAACRQLGYYDQSTFGTVEALGWVYFSRLDYIQSLLMIVGVASWGSALTQNPTELSSSLD